MGEERKLSRREFLRIALGSAAGLIVGGAVGYYISPGKITEEKAPTKVEIPEVIKIGSAHPLTGWDASNGREMHRGTEMAIEEINNQGGIFGAEIEWIELDSEDMSAEKMTSVMTTLATSKQVHWVIYGYTATYAPTYRTLAQYDIPFMHVDTASEFIDWIKENPDKKHLAWMADAYDLYYGIGFSIFIDNLIKKEVWTPRNKKFAVLRGEDVFAQRIAEKFIEEMTGRGWTLAVDQTVSFETVEFGPFLTKVREEDPDVILNTDWSPTGFANFMIQFTENPTQSLIYGQWAPSTPEFKDLAGDAANGLIWSSVIGWLPLDTDPIAKEWYQKYKNKYNEEPGLMAAVCYDMIWLWANAVAITGSIDPVKMEPVLEKLLYRGVCGTYNFVKDEHYCICYPDDVYDPSLGLPHWHFQIKEGSDVTIAPDPYAEEEFETPPWF